MRIFFLGCLLSVFLSAQGSILEVCQQGCAFESVKRAIESSEKGDTILIKSGVYQEFDILIDKPLCILGEPGAIIDAEGQGEIIRIESNEVIVSGLTFRNVGISYVKDLAAVNVINCSGCKIQDNILENTFFGIYLQKSDSCQIVGNTITGEAEQEMSSGNAIHLWYCKKILIKDNISEQHRDGIYLEFVDSSRIEQNISIRNVRYGLHFMFSNHNNYISNEFAENGAGVAVMFSKHINMYRNLFLNNWGNSSYGLLLKDITDSEISDNTFERNTTGIYAESAGRILISGNDFLRNGWAMKILGSSMDNNIVDNNLIGNTLDLTTNASRNTNTYSGNYWSSYKGYDLDLDGYGDVPHRPVQLFSYIIGQVPEAIVLVRSPLVDLLNFVESTTPVFTPTGLEDKRPSMRRIIKVSIND